MAALGPPQATCDSMIVLAACCPRVCLPPVRGCCPCQRLDQLMSLRGSRNTLRMKASVGEGEGVWVRGGGGALWVCGAQGFILSPVEPPPLPSSPDRT